MSNPPPAPERASPPYLLIFGILIGVGLLAFMLWQSISQSRQNLGPTVDVTVATWQKEVLESDIPVLVDFWAEW